MSSLFKLAKSDFRFPSVCACSRMCLPVYAIASVRDRLCACLPVWVCVWLCAVGPWSRQAGPTNRKPGASSARARFICTLSRRGAFRGTRLAARCDEHCNSAELFLPVPRLDTLGSQYHGRLSFRSCALTALFEELVL